MKIAVLVVICLVPLFTIPAFAESIPPWIKNNADWWEKGLISDKEFATGIAYMVKENIIIVENVEVDPEGDIVIDENITIPTWIQNNARWWADGAISDDDFKSGIQFMLKENIIQISDKQVEPDSQSLQSFSQFMSQEEFEKEILQFCSLAISDPHSEEFETNCELLQTPGTIENIYSILDELWQDSPKVYYEKLVGGKNLFGTLISMGDVNAEGFIELFLGPCTADPFGYGEIIVTDKWSSFTKLSDEEGYELHWGWTIAYKDPNSPYSTAGMLVNFDAQGPYPYEQVDWYYADDTGRLDSISWTSNPGTYTFKIVDFESLGSYCGYGDRITILVN